MRSTQRHPGRDHADGEAEDQGDDDAREGLGQGVQGVVPHVDDADAGHRQGGGGHGAPAAGEQGETGCQQHQQPPRRAGQGVADRVEHPGGEVGGPGAGAAEHRDASARWSVNQPTALLTGCAMSTVHASGQSAISSSQPTVPTTAPVPAVRVQARQPCSQGAPSGPGALAEPVAGDGGGAVQPHRQQHDGDARGERGADVDRGQRPEDLLTETAGADHRGDGDHGQRHHDRLVQAEQDLLAGQRQPRGQQALHRAGAERLGGLHDALVGAAQTERGQPGHGRRRVDDRRDQRGGHADVEQQHQRQQVRERRHDLHGVQHRSQDRARSGPRGRRRGRARRR